MDVFSSLIGILHMLVAEGSFLPSCKLQPVGESLGLSAESRVVRVLFGGFFFGQFPMSSISVKNISSSAFSW